MTASPVTTILPAYVFSPLANWSLCFVTFSVPAPDTAPPNVNGVPYPAPVTYTVPERRIGPAKLNMFVPERQSENGRLLGSV